MEETSDSCKVDFTEIVSLSRDADGSCTTECVSGDWFGEGREVDLTDLKQEPDNVCFIFCFTYSVYYDNEFMQIIGYFLARFLTWMITMMY